MRKAKNKDNINNNLDKDDNAADNTVKPLDSENPVIPGPEIQDKPEQQPEITDKEDLSADMMNTNESSQNEETTEKERVNNQESVHEINDAEQSALSEMEEKPEKTDDVRAETETASEQSENDSPSVHKESNYQVSLVDENTLKVKVTTNDSVSLDFSVKDKSTAESSEETQSNKIFIRPRHGSLKQEVEILVKIGDIKGTETEVEMKPSVDIPKPKLTPNPIVADLIQRFSKPKPVEEKTGPKTPDDILEDKLVRKNPWIINREFMRKNLQYGFYAANIIVIIFSIIVYNIAAGKKPDPNNGEEQKRLIVMQDLPENLNQLNQQVDDPNKPPEEEESTTGSDVTAPVVRTPKIRPPKVIVPKVDTDTSVSSINKELDSLRKKNLTVNITGTGDSTLINTSLLPDSLLKTLTENEVGLVGKFPPNWKQIDSRAININQKEFTGIILVDTTAKRKEEAVNMSIQLDPKGSYFNTYKFEKVMEEDSLRTLFNIEPKVEGNLTYYRFYVASKSGNVFISSYVEPGTFEKYKPEIEQVVKSIYIKLPEKK
ncbi:MAG: hypothetical protein L0Y76_12745 [Ignavibacteria bacterium]|nr:hypothetical protein [Ignavibacteria bacterium]